MEGKLTSYRALATQREYCKLILANVVNRLGDSLDAIAFSWMMYEVTKNAALMALIMALNYIPTIVLQPVSGVFTDHWDKRAVMAWCDIGRGVVVAATALVFSAGYLTPALIALSTVLNSSLEALRVPAGIAVVPSILDEDKYILGSAFSTGLSRACEFVGLALAGAAIAAVGVMGALLIDAGTFLFSAVCIFAIRLNDAPAHEKLTLKGVTGDFREGFRYLKSGATLRSLLVLGMLMNFVTVPVSVFGAAYVSDFMRSGPELLSYMELAMVAGMALGALATPKLSRVSDKTLIVATGLAQAAMFASLGICPRLGGGAARAVAVAAMGMIGLGSGAQNTVFSAAFMRLVDKKFLGRIGGLVNAVLCASIPVSALLCSAAAAYLPVTTVLIASGALAVPLFVALSKAPGFDEI